MNRRGFLGSILALGAAPAIVRASSLMPLLVPSREIALPTIDEIIATTLRARSAELAWNVIRNNELLRVLRKHGVVKPFTGGIVVS